MRVISLPVSRDITRPWKNPNSASPVLNIELRAACKVLGLPYRGGAAIRCHDLQHTFAYLCGSNGADLGDLQYLLGHSDIAMTMRYRNFIQSRARNAVSGMRSVSAASCHDNNDEPTIRLRLNVGCVTIKQPLFLTSQTHKTHKIIFKPLILNKSFFITGAPTRTRSTDLLITKYLPQG
jgi:hypothetical protein